MFMVGNVSGKDQTENVLSTYHKQKTSASRMQPPTPKMLIHIFCNKGCYENYCMPPFPNLNQVTFTSKLSLVARWKESDDLKQVIASMPECEAKRRRYI